MIKKEKIRKATAVFFLCLLLTDTLLPMGAKALTTGPSQPESKQFTGAGTAEMVDLFTGDFKYNVPLLEVDGYPVNLSYQGGVSMDDEASWAGLGWNVNVGAINRALRGVPDDMSGDEVLTEHNIKPKITVGGRVTARIELKGTDMAKVSGSVSMGIFSDNYTGIGAEIGGNAGITLGLAGGGVGTSGLGLSAGLGFNSSTASGVDISPSISLSWKQQASEMTAGSAAISMNLGYNTREGLKNLSLGGSFGIQGQDDYGSGSNSYDVATSTFNYNTPSIYPRIQMPYRTVSRTFSGDFGGVAFAIFGGGGFTGYKSVREVLNRNNQNPSFGFLYADRGKKIRPAVMDFLREKDNVIIPTLPNLAMPISTPDMFAYSGQAGSGQFRLYSGTSGIYFDAESRDESDNQTLGADVGLGAYVHGGVSFYKQNLRTVTGKWEGDNTYKNKGDFEDLGATDPREEGTYFKQVGEKNAEDPGFSNAIKGERPVWVDVTGKAAIPNYAYMDDEAIRKSDPITLSKVKKTGRQKRRSPITYLTAAEAAKGGLDKTIKNYGFNNYNSFTPATCSPAVLSDLARVGEKRRNHHLSELSVTGDNGQRMVYGLPVYNIKQEECTFAVDAGRVQLDATEIATKNQVTYQLGDKTTDQYYKKETQPAYATSFLLTGLLSADYVDVTGNGITDDDLGTAVKFNYGKLPTNYQWRSPYDVNRAFYNKGLYADPNDDKGSFVYGEREVWYLHSIETKTKICYFITEDRRDALGVNDLMGGKNINVKQKRLAEIRLYSKSDLSKPIKTVVLDHGYTLCGGAKLPNTITAGEGKLTLNRLYFKYGNSTKGLNHPYVFEYNNADYDYLLSDRWGAYKPLANNTTDGFSAFRNNEFPYTTRTPASANANAGAWLLKKISLPGGGDVQVEYESDDYAYVQNKKAMEMIKVEGFAKGNTTPATATNLKEAEWIKLKLNKKPTTVSGLLNWFRKEYLDNSSNLYVKMFVNVTDAPGSSNAANFDFVSAYVEVEDAYMTSAMDDYIHIKMKPVDGGNPLIVAAWQKMKLEYPMYAYPGYKNRVQDNKPVEAVLSAVINSFRTLNEINENFYERARRKNYADMVDLNKSFARIVKTDGRRFGGGSRVKKVKLSDQWAAMTSILLNETATYGQEYSYKTTWNGQEISSGVASYEPSIGGDENPLHQPVSYTQDIKGALNNYLYLEEPFGETLFPSPQVGYSKVTIRDLDESGNADPEKMTGYSEHEFYTAREYPVITRHSSIETHNRHPNGFSNFVGGHELHELSMTQGYTIILNDMHGKPKSGRVFNKSGAEISSDVYYYADENMGAGSKRLNNLVYTVNDKGEVSAAKEVIGREMELFTDMREEEMSNSGQSIHIGVDVIPFIWFPLPIPHWPVRNNDEYRLFRSASVTKVAHYYGILERTVKTQNGSSITSRNLVFDQVTGDPVVSSTTNEFDDPVYSFNMPAYWAYKQMGGAYQNVNTVLKSFTTGTNGVISSSFTPYVSPGDELINVRNSGDVQRYWVIYSQPGTIGTKEFRLIDRNGAVMANFNQDLKIVRSGYRNMLQSTAGSIVSLDNPVKNNYLRMENAALTWLRVLDTKATQFDDEWGMPDECTTCPPGTVRQADGNCVYVPVENTSNCFTFCAGSNNNAYSVDGAFVYTSTADAAPLSLISPYWGNGPGCVRSGFNMMGANMVQSGANDSASAKAFLPKSLSAGMGTMALPAACTRSDYNVTSTYCGRLPVCRIWLCTPLPSTGNVTPIDQWLGFETCVNIPQSGTYYIGMGGDNSVEVKIGTSFTVTKSNGALTSNHKRWHLYPLYLPAGPVTIRVAGRNEETAAGFGMEIYKATRDQILASAPEAIIFSTKDIPGKQVQAFVENSANSNTYSWRYTGCSNGGAVNTCALANCGVAAVNPYVAGYLGNWRTWKENGYIVNRVDNGVLSPETKGARLRNSGHYQMVPWWYYNTSSQQWDKATATTTDGRWVTQKNILLYGKYGEELENLDVLGRYSGAIFGFEGAQPTAVASNAQSREIYYESFEDFKFRDRCGAEASCNKFTFDIKRVLGSSYEGMLMQSEPHSGNHSLYLSSPITLFTTAHSLTHKSGMAGNVYLTNSIRGEYQKKDIKGLYHNGFAPVAGKKYIFSAWVRDDQPTSTSPGITLQVNGTSIALTRKAVVEGWKLVEGTVDLNALGVLDGHSWKITGGASILIDDIRIFPYDAHMRTFAYDEFSLRVMAEMDENNFSNFYEYDEEGSLIRVKKETERGIMTIRETRGSLRKQ